MLVTPDEELIRAVEGLALWEAAWLIARRTRARSSSARSRREDAHSAPSCTNRRTHYRRIGREWTVPTGGPPGVVALKPRPIGSPSTDLPRHTAQGMG